MCHLALTTKRILIPDNICDEHCNRQECRWNWYLWLHHLILRSIHIENCVIRNIRSASNDRIFEYGFLIYGWYRHTHVSVTISNVSFENNQPSHYSGIDGSKSMDFMALRPNPRHFSLTPTRRKDPSTSQTGAAVWWSLRLPTTQHLSIFSLR